MDSQPWAGLAGTLFLLCSIEKARVPHWILVATLSIAAGVIASMSLSDNPVSASTMRAMASYGTFIIVLLAFYLYLLEYGFPRTLFLIAGISWFAFGVIELFEPSISMRMSEYRTDPTRGVTSLAPEPTYFGIFLFFWTWLLLLSSRYTPRRADNAFAIASLLSIFLLAQSSMVAVFLGIATSLVIAAKAANFVLGGRLKTAQLVWTLGTVVLAVIALPLVIDAAEESRLANLLSAPASVLQDASVSQRLESIVLSMHASIVNWGIPGGFDTFYEAKEALRPLWEDLFFRPLQHDKILSWMGAMIYELGIFGLFAIASVAAGAKVRGATWLELTLMLTLLFNAIPVAFPLIPMIVACWYWRRGTFRNSGAEMNL
tara:strand:+ start:5052 stop:6173 length:1122 start_codon:yes stop_codon:yes gene_type:complete